MVPTCGSIASRSSLPVREDNRWLRRLQADMVTDSRSMRRSQRGQLTVWPARRSHQRFSMSAAIRQSRLGSMPAFSSQSIPSRSIAASVTYTLTSLTDDIARTVTLAGGVRLVLLSVTSRTAGDYLTVGAAASNPWTSPFAGTTPALKVFDLLVLGIGSTDKYAVANGSNEQLKIVNSGSNPITFKLALLGCAT